MSKLRSCCVPCCKDEKFTLVHKFPSDNERAEQWRRVLSIDSFIGLPIEIIRKRYYICSRHFRDSDYKNKASRSINVTAVPSINLVTLNDAEGLNRDLPPPNRPGMVPLESSLEATKQEDPVGRELPREVHKDQVMESSARSSSMNLGLNDLINDSYTDDVFVTSKNESLSLNATRLSTPQMPPPGLKRIFSERPVSMQTPISSQEPKAKVPPTVTNNVLRRSSIMKPSLTAVPLAGLSAADKKSLVLKRVKMPPLMVERKASPLANAMTQTDEVPVTVDKPSVRDDEQEEKDEPVPPTSTKVLALLECTPDNLQRLQRKLQEEGGALCLDERLLRLDDEDELERDKAMHADKTDVTLDKNRFLTVRNIDTDESVSVSYVWLRDHCRCEDCYNVATFQRSTSILDLPLDIQPELCTICDEKINIIWQDGHRSSYDLTMVFKNHVDSLRVQLEKHQAQLVLWDHELITATPPGYARVTLNDLLCEDAIMQQVVSSLITYGFAFITKVPPNQQSTEMAVKRIFPVQRTLFGDMWTFSESKMDHSDTAYTNGFLGPHTDNTYFSDAAGLQVLHCIQFNGKGGETILVDGFRAVDHLRQTDAAAYERLCEYPLEAEYIEEDKHHRYVAPVIRKHPVLPDAIEQIRFNPYDRAPLRTLAPEKVPQFYADYRQLAEQLHREEAQWKFQLTPGTVLIFDNWRVLHGRMAYSGKRVMTGCYVARTEYQSVARTMALVE
uniref:Trimethyllysine dioxygenase, mitochondrial n=1 Tax=Anopheles minimus TaxID=112268 RepID=A0A182WLW0_9DIPT